MLRAPEGPGSRLENGGLQVPLRGPFSLGIRELGVLAMDLFGILSGHYGGSSHCLLFNSFQSSLLVRKSVVGTLMLGKQMVVTMVSSILSQLPQSLLYLFNFSLLFICV